MARRAAILLSSCASVALGCAPTIPAHTAHVPPFVDDVRPPRSTAFLRADVPLDGLAAALESVVPARSDGSREISVGMLGTVVARWALTRQPVSARATPDGLEVGFVSRGEVSIVGGLIRCRSDDAGVAVSVSARPALDPGGWVSLVAPRVSARPFGELRCAGVEFPIGRVLELAIAPIGRGVEELIGQLRLPLAPLVRWGLSELAHPRALDVAGHQACLDLDPDALVLSPVGGNGGTQLALELGAQVAPRGPCAKTPAPPRALGPILVREQALADQYHVDVAVTVPYEEVERHLRPLVEGHTFGDGDQRIVVRRVELGDANGRVLARVEVAGALKGTLYLWGTPRVVARNGALVLEVPELQVAVESRDAITHLRLWMWKLLDGGLQPALRRSLSLPIADRLETIRRSLDRTITLVDGSPSLLLHSHLSLIVPGTVDSRPGALVAHGQLIGRAELELR